MVLLDQMITEFLKLLGTTMLFISTNSVQGLCFNVPISLPAL
jgi:hypothetical protein